MPHVAGGRPRPACAKPEQPGQVRVTSLPHLRAHCGTSPFKSSPVSDPVRIGILGDYDPKCLRPFPPSRKSNLQHAVRDVESAGGRREVDRNSKPAQASTRRKARESFSTGSGPRRVSPYKSFGRHA